MPASPTPSGSPNMIDFTGIRVVVKWSKPDGQTCFLSAGDTMSTESGSLTLDCHFRPSSKTASFRLRAPILLKGLGRKLTPLFMFIAPERIESLAFDDEEKTLVPGPVRQLMGEGHVVSLRFRLRHAGDLVVPPHSPLVPRKKLFWDTFDSLKNLAQETDFAMYLSHDDIPSKACMVSLCEAVSAGKLTTSTTHADITRLYDGQGGKLLAGEDPAIPASASMDTPPSYDELGPPPPAPPMEKHHSVSSNKDASITSSSSRKRRRTSSNGDDVASMHVSQGDHLPDTDRMEATCRKIMGEMTAEWREQGDQLRNEIQQMETRIKDWVDERLTKHAADLRREIERTSVQQQNQVRDQVQELRAEVRQVSDETQETFDRIEEAKEDMQAFKDETSELVDGRLEEQLDTVRNELEEYVVEQMHEAQERIVDHIRSNVYIDFNIYD